MQAPATVASVSPGPGGGRNGSMLNPKSGTAGRSTTGQAYDDRINYYVAASTTRFPVALKAGDALISTISSPDNGNHTSPYRSTSSIAYLRTAAVLSCVARPVPAGTFRPAYCGPKQFHSESSIRWDKLPNLPSLASSPDPATYASYLQRPWLDHLVGYDSRYMHPYENMPDYGREITTLTSEAGLLLLEGRSRAELRNLMINYVQVGIDLYGLVQDGHEWWADGGHMNGRKWPVIFAGLMLDQPGMQSPGNKFSEDLSTYFASGWTGVHVVYRMRSGDNHEEKHPSQWDANDIKYEKYRRCCTSVAWIGEALCAHIMRATTLWNHAPFFEYTDRWMSPQNPNDQALTATIVGGSTVQSFPHESTFGGTYARDMWWTYRNRYLPSGITFVPARSQYPIRVHVFDTPQPNQMVKLYVQNAPMRLGVAMASPTITTQPMRFLNANFMLGQVPPVAIGFQADSHGKAIVALKMPLTRGLTFGVQMGWLDQARPAAETSDAFKIIL